MRQNRTVLQLLQALWSRAEVRLLIALAAIILTLLLIHQLSGVLVTVIGAYALAFLVNPVLSWFERRGLARSWGVLLLSVLLIGVVWLLFWRLASQITDFVNTLPALAARLTALLDRGLAQRIFRVASVAIPPLVSKYLKTRICKRFARIWPMQPVIWTTMPASLRDAGEV